MGGCDPGKAGRHGRHVDPCPLVSKAMRRPEATADIFPASISACTCHACDPAKKNQAPAVLGAPTPLSADGVSGSPRYPSRCIAP